MASFMADRTASFPDASANPIVAVQATAAVPQGVRRIGNIAQHPRDIWRAVDGKLVTDYSKIPPGHAWTGAVGRLYQSTATGMWEISYDRLGGMVRTSSLYEGHCIGGHEITGYMNAFRYRAAMNNYFYRAHPDTEMRERVPEVGPILDLLEEFEEDAR
jgi:hypothetical protein